jgi:uncharacterized lipoprotein YddW (UPF0748 family)
MDFHGALGTSRSDHQIVTFCVPKRRSRGAVHGAALAALLSVFLFSNGTALGQVVIADAVRLVHVDGPSVAEVIVDNGDDAFFVNGDWGIGQFSGGYQGDYLWAGVSDDSLATAHWRLTPPVEGDYEVFIWYTASSNRSPQTRCRLEHAGGVSEITLDQTTGGDWEPLGTLHFVVSDYLFQLSNRFTPTLVEPLIIDDGDPLFETVGSWTDGTVSPGYGDDYVYSVCAPTPTASATWSVPIFVAGNYELDVAFRPGANRSDAAHYTIPYAGGERLLELDQTTASSSGSWEWYALGLYPFDVGRHPVTLTNEGPSDRVVIADALRVRFSENQEPAPPSIDLMGDVVPTPTSGEPIPILASVWSPSPLTSVVVEQRVSGETVSAPLWDDGAHGDGDPGDGVHGGEIAGGPAATVLEYRVSAENSAGGSAATLWLKCLVAHESFDQPELRAVFAYRIATPEEIASLLDRVRMGHFNTVIVSVFSNGNVRYVSDIVPMDDRVSVGFDPLGYLIEQAHDTSGGQQRIQVHALVMNYHARGDEVIPPWHVLDQHPEWMSETCDGEIYGYDRLYMDQGIPAVQDYLVEVYNELFTNYDIDGLNLDFIRYRGTQIWGYNAIALSHFHAHTGRSDRPLPDDPEWMEWRREQVTCFVRRVSANLQRLRPGALLTIDGTSSGPPLEPPEANVFFWSVFQDWPTWVNEGMIDGVLGMAYRGEDDPAMAQEFRDWLSFFRAHRASREAIAIVGGYRNRVQHSLVQLHHVRETGSPWLTLFSDSSPDNESGPQETFYTAARSQLFPTPVDPPVMPWMQGGREGLVMGSVTCGGAPAERVRLTLDETHEILSDLTGFFAFFNLPPGNHVVRVLSSAGQILAEEGISLAEGEVVEISLEIEAPTTDQEGVLIR